MDPVTKKNWRQRSWTIPISVMLHVLIVGAFYLQWPESMEAPAEPESVSVELVEPPKEEPPKEEPKPEEKKAEEPPPPPPPVEQKPEEQQKTAPSQMSSVPIRPNPTQLDESDEQGEQEAGGEEQAKPEQQSDVPQPVAAPSPGPNENDTQPEPSAAQPTAQQGEIPAVETSAQDDSAAVAVPLPKPETEPAPAQPAKVLPNGAGDPKLKPAKKILVSAKRPGPMMRQVFGNLPPGDRVRQLCFAEIVGQIREERKGRSPPEGVIYMKRDIVGKVMDAKGAFNVGPEWFPITYRCEVDIDNYVVTDFRFEIRPKLSPDEVERLGLRTD